MGAAIGIYLVVVMVYVALVGEPEQDDFADDLGPLPIQILLIAIAAPISEEVCFRGMLFGGLRERLPMWAAALISAALFGLLHATTGISAVPPLIAFGFLLALLYERTGSILPGILLHMLNNSVALLASSIRAVKRLVLTALVVCAARPASASGAAAGREGAESRRSPKPAPRARR